MSGSVTTDASQHTNSDDRVLEIPNRCDNATPIEQWRSALQEPTKRVIRTNGFYDQLTQWQGENARKLKDENDNESEWFASIPIAIARPAVSQGHGALKAHGDAVKGRTIRTLEEQSNGDRWLKKNPDFDTGAWDALSIEEKRKRVRTGLAPPKSISTWHRDERAGDGTRMTLFRTRKRSGRCAALWCGTHLRSGWVRPPYGSLD